MPQKKFLIAFVQAAISGRSRIRLEFWRAVRAHGKEMCFKRGRNGTQTLSSASLQSMVRDGRAVQLPNETCIGLKEGLFLEPNRDIIVSTGLEGPILRVASRMPAAEDVTMPATQGFGTRRTHYGDPRFGA